MSAKQHSHIEVAGVHTASDELAQLRRYMAALEAEAASPCKPTTEVAAAEGPAPASPQPTDVQHIAAALEVRYEERELELRLRTADVVASQRRQRTLLAGDESTFRDRLEDSEDEFRQGLALMAATRFQIVSQKAARRLYNDAKLQEVNEWSAQASRLNTMDADFLQHDKRRTMESISRHEEQRQAEEGHYRRRRDAERQLTLYADEDELLTQDFLMSRLGLVRPSG
jgi:hypothetical protein